MIVKRFEQLNELEKRYINPLIIIIVIIFKYVLLSVIL